VKPLEDIPDIFLVINDKWEESRLKIEGLAFFIVLVLFCLKKLNSLIL
jgi:hypothetical protein